MTDTIDLRAQKVRGGQMSGVFWDNGGTVIHVMHPDYGAKCTGTDDDTLAVQAALAVANVLGLPVQFPPGTTTLLTDEVRFANHGVIARGSTTRTTRIRFNPFTPKGCFNFKYDDAAYAALPLTLNECRVEGLTFESTNLVQKLFAVRWVDVSRFHMQHVSVHYSWTSTAGKSTAYESMGREHVTAKDCTAYADLPLVFSQNPRDGGSGIDADFVTWDGGELTPTILTATAGVGTVSCAAGVATFSTSQAGKVSAGGLIVVGGITYSVQTFTGTTGATLKLIAAPYTTTPTFGASAFTTRLASTDYAITLNPNLRGIFHIKFRDVVFPSGMGVLSWVGAGATRDADGIIFEHCRAEQNQNTLGCFMNIERDGWTVAGVEIRGCRLSFTQHGVRGRRMDAPLISACSYQTGDPTLKAVDFDATVNKPSWRKFVTQAGVGYSLTGLFLTWSSGRYGSVDYGLIPSADYDNVATTEFAVGRMTSLRVDGPIGHGIAPQANIGVYSNQTIAASGAAADMLRLIPVLSASANGDQLVGINLAPTYTINSKTGVTCYGLRVGNVAGGATNRAIITGTGIVEFGDDVYRGASKLLGTRKTGWSVATGTATRTSFATGSVTLPALAEAVKALIDDLHATAGHGLIGT